VDWWWQEQGRWQLSCGGVAVDSWWQGQGHFVAVALRQQLCGSAAAAASLAEAAAALLQCSIGCGGGSG
jgi:hypothetical protein